MRCVRVALAVGAAALAAASCDAVRVVTGTTLSAAGQGLARDTLGRLFPAIMFNVSTAPGGVGWNQETCYAKLLSATKPGSAIGLMLENGRRCWLIAQAQSDFVFNAGSTGGRGSSEAQLPVVNDVFETGSDALFLLNVLGTEPPSVPTTSAPSPPKSAAPSTPSTPSTPAPSSAQPPAAAANGADGAPAPEPGTELGIVVAGVFGSILLTLVGAYGTYALQQKRIAVHLASQESSVVSAKDLPEGYSQHSSQAYSAHSQASWPASSRADGAV
jgi:hypothetical protein